MQIHPAQQLHARKAACDSSSHATALSEASQQQQQDPCTCTDTHSMQQQGTAEQQDAYGFPLEGLSAEQRAERAACAAYEARRRAKWQVYVDAQELPSGAKLKRYCRKVRWGCTAGAVVWFWVKASAVVHAGTYIVVSTAAAAGVQTETKACV